MGETSKHKARKKYDGFTLVELLIVIGIIGVLGTVAVVVIKPAELLKQARDSTRFSDIDTINKALAIAQVDSLPLGTANTIYVSIPDTLSNCESLGLPTPPSGWSYACVTAANLRNTNGAGWIPVNFTAASIGSPISVLPVDPANSTSSNLYYAYTTSNGSYTIEAQAFESAKYVAANPSGFSLGNGPALPKQCGDPTYTVTGPDGLTYGTVVGADTKCWLDRNLGATRVATSSTDTLAYGHLYQWGRGVDGHQITTSGVTTVLSFTDSPGHANFIYGMATPYDWRSPQNTNLWQGVSGINNPCPTGFRLPTQPEWASLVTAAGITNSATAYGSSLKLTVAGYRTFSTAVLYNRGSAGYCWSSSPGEIFSFSASTVSLTTLSNRASGRSVRCVKN